MDFSTDTVPVLDARQSDDGSQLLVWCKYCGRSHYHGRHRLCTACTYDWGAMDNLPGDVCTCPTGTGDGHRVAHCHNPKSPYINGGYILKEVGHPDEVPELIHVDCGQPLTRNPHPRFDPNRQDARGFFAAATAATDAPTAQTTTPTADADSATTNHEKGASHDAKKPR